MQIYKHEIDAGLEEQIQANASFGLLADPIVYEPSISEKKAWHSLLTVGEANPNQLDLFYLTSILVSTGWNKNDDVFGHYETWKARSTPVDKPFNYMHDPRDVIGHLTSSIIFDFDGNVIANDTPMDDIPENFDIVVGSVLYRSFPKDKDRQERIEKIIAEIPDRKWKVSMECLFSNFDYAVIKPDGTNHTIARCEESSFLTKHLRAYGGRGEYEGHRIGRFLKNFTFSGKGLVDNPANPRSDVISYSDKSETKVFVNASVVDFNILNEGPNMADTVNKEQYDLLKTELDRVKAESAEKDKSINDLKSQIAALNQAQADMQSNIDSVTSTKDTEIEQLKADLKVVQDELNEKKTELATIEAEATKAMRLAKIKEKDVDDEKASNLIEKFADASDEMFDTLVAALPEKKSLEEDETSEEDRANAEQATEEIVGSEVENETELANASEDEIQQTVAGWIGDSVLRSTAKK